MERGLNRACETGQYIIPLWSSFFLAVELEKQKGIVGRQPQGQGLTGKVDGTNGSARPRGSLDDSCIVSEGLKRTALSNSLRDLSGEGKLVMLLKS